MKFESAKELHALKDKSPVDPDGRGKTIELFGFHNVFSSDIGAIPATPIILTEELLKKKPISVVKFICISNTFLYDENGHKVKFDSRFLNSQVHVFTTEREAWKDFSVQLNLRKEAFLEYQKVEIKLIEQAENSITERMKGNPEYFV